MNTSTNTNTDTGQAGTAFPSGAQPVPYRRMTVLAAFRLAAVHTWPAALCPAMFGLFMVASVKGERKIGLYILLSIVTPLVLFFGFYYGFQTLLPPGVLKPLLTYL